MKAKQLSLTELLRYSIFQFAVLQTILFCWLAFSSLNWIWSSFVSLLIFSLIYYVLHTITDALRLLKEMEKSHYDSECK